MRKRIRASLRRTPRDTGMRAPGGRGTARDRWGGMDTPAPTATAQRLAAILYHDEATLVLWSPIDEPLLRSRLPCTPAVGRHPRGGDTPDEAWCEAASLLRAAPSPYR